MGCGPPGQPAHVYKYYYFVGIINMFLLSISEFYFLLGTVQYLWQYGTSKLDTGPAVTFDLRADGAVCFSEASAYGATAYF